MDSLLTSIATTVAAGYFLKLSVVQGALLWFVLYFVVGYLTLFVKNAIAVRRTGFPQVWVPWDPHSFWWMVLQHPLSPILKRWLPKLLWERIAVTAYGWEFHEKNRPFDQYAAPQGNRKSFMNVSFTKGLELWTWDAEIATQVLARPRDFQVQDLTSLFMDKFGKSLLTSNGEPWARQRKVVASVINEKISKAVFNESIRQTGGLIDELFAAQGMMLAKGLPAKVDTNKMFDMMKKITIHVLSGVGMGAAVPWNDEQGEKPRPGYKTSYMQACKTVTYAVGGPIILPRWFLDNYPSFLPGAAFLHQLGESIREFPAHTRHMLDAERRRSAMSKDGEARGNIMSQMLRASESSKDGKGPTLSEDEMTGNLFIFTVAGFDTTANTLSFSLMLLARHPEWQDWLNEETDPLIPGDPGATAELEYTEVHPKATRVLALMYETLRLFPALVHMVKQAHGDVTLQTSTGTYIIPDGTYVYINNVGIHIDAEVYRNLNLNADNNEMGSADDELRFRPTRWLNPNSAGSTLYQPPKGAFLPWSSGPRSCPGIKMAQVEFVAVMLVLLRQCRIEATPLPGESRSQTEERLERQMQSSMSKLTLEMKGVYDMTDEQGGFKLRLQRRT